MKLFIIINSYISNISVIKNYFNSTNFHITYFEYSGDLFEYTKLIDALDKNTNIKIIVFTTNGVGEFIVSNKISLIRAASVTDEFTAKNVVAHNDVQIIILPLTIISFEYAIRLINIFINNVFEGGRHRSRIDILNKLC